MTGYTIPDGAAGGAEGSKFSINSAGALSFKTAPDFENPTDTGANNTYVVAVRATSDMTETKDNMIAFLFELNAETGSRVRTTDQTITVTVTDVADGGTGQGADGTSQDEATTAPDPVNSGSISVTHLSHRFSNRFSRTGC